MGLISSVWGANLRENRLQQMAGGLGGRAAPQGCLPDRCRGSDATVTSRMGLSSEQYAGFGLRFTSVSDHARARRWLTGQQVSVQC